LRRRAPAPRCSAATAAGRPASEPPAEPGRSPCRGAPRRGRFYARGDAVGRLVVSRKRSYPLLMQHHGAAPARVAGEVVGAVVLAAVTFLVAFYAVAAAGMVSTWLGIVVGLAVAAVGVYELARGDTKRRVFG